MVVSWRPSRPFMTCYCRPYLGVAASCHSSHPFTVYGYRFHDLHRPYRGMAIPLTLQRLSDSFLLTL